MEDVDLDGGGGSGRKYRPVLDSDRAVLEMSSMDPGSSSAASSSQPFRDQPPPNLRKINVGNGATEASNAKEGNNSPSQPQPNGSHQESKLELFGFDSLVNILGLKSMTSEQAVQPSSPREGEDISITVGEPKPAAPKLGTMMGVFIPCIQSILGIIYYIRFSWIVGMAGIGESFLLVALCGLCTFLTSISLSAIATNGAMKGGGPYYLIGRALGPEVGVSIGICFFLGNAVAGALYVLGAVETFLKAVPKAGIFRETVSHVNGTAVTPIEAPSSHDLQIYGIVVTILLCFIVFGGVKMINRVAPAFLVPVLFSVICIFLGMFVAKKDKPSVIMFLISWSFTVVALALASLIYKYVGLKGKAGDWGDGFKSAYFQLALRSLRSLGENQVHPKNWYPIPLVFCRPWGQLPENVPCHPKLADFANCMKKKGRGMSIFVSILDGDYHECAEDAKTACKQLSTYINYKNCEGVAEIVVAPNMSEGFRGIVQTMGLGNLKPNIVVMRYPEIWRRENLTEIPKTFVGIINDCIVANKAVVIVKGLDEWPNEYQKQYGTIDLYWIVRDGGLMLLLSQLLLTKDSFESCKIQVFCIAEEDADAEVLKADVRKFLYDLRMQAEVFVIPISSQENGGSPQDESQDAFKGAQQRIDDYLNKMKAAAKKDGTPLMADGKRAVVNEQQVEKFLFTTLKLNSIMLRYSRMAAVVLVSLPPPPLNHPAYFYMEYMDMLLENIPRILIVRGYRRDVVTLFT
nr:cation-chloride cotransporter 1 isoform X3 [Arachis hypogaea]